MSEYREAARAAIGSGLCRLPRVWTGDFGPYEIADAVVTLPEFAALLAAPGTAAEVTEPLGPFPADLVHPLTTDSRRLRDSRCGHSDVNGRPDQTPPTVIQDADLLLRIVSLCRRFGDAFKESRVTNVHLPSKAPLSTRGEVEQ